MSLDIRCIDTMNWSKDTLRGQKTQAEIDELIDLDVATFDLTHIAVSVPIDDYTNYPDPQPADGYIDKWVSSIRRVNKKIYWRNTQIAFEAIYDKPKATPTGTPSRALGVASEVLAGTDTTSYLYSVYQYIIDHPTFFATGDIWGVMPEPENTGVGAGASNMFSSYAVCAQWLEDIKTVADSAFSTIGVSGVLTGYTAWNGSEMLSGAVQASYITSLGIVSMDHYQSDSTRMAQDVATVNARYPSQKILISEWGAKDDGTDEAAKSLRIYKTFNALARNPNIKGFCYWRDVGGNESVIDKTVSPLVIKESARQLALCFSSNGARVRIPVL